MQRAILNPDPLAPAKAQPNEPPWPASRRPTQAKAQPSAPPPPTLGVRPVTPRAILRDDGPPHAVLTPVTRAVLKPDPPALVLPKPLLAKRTRNRGQTAAMIQLDLQIVEVLTADHPQSVRHVFYRMTDPRLAYAVAKTEAGYKQVGRELIKLRESGRIPYRWVVDETRDAPRFGPIRRTPGDSLRSAARFFDVDPWHFAPRLCQVWVESRSLAGVIRGECSSLSVPYADLRAAQDPQPDQVCLGRVPPQQNTTETSSSRDGDRTRP